MAIIRKAKNPIVNEDAAFDRFVSGVDKALVTEPKPEKTDPVRKKKSGRKTPITLTIDAKLLTRIDQMAEAQGVSRAAFIAMGMHYVVEHGILKA